MSERISDYAVKSCVLTEKLSRNNEEKYSLDFIERALAESFDSSSKNLVLRLRCSGFEYINCLLGTASELNQQPEAESPNVNQSNPD